MTFSVISSNLLYVCNLSLIVLVFDLSLSDSKCGTGLVIRKVPLTWAAVHRHVNSLSELFSREKKTGMNNVAPDTRAHHSSFSEEKQCEMTHAF